LAAPGGCGPYCRDSAKELHNAMPEYTVTP